MDDSGQPVPGVTVTLKPAAAEEETDSSGRFAFRNLPAGEYEVAATLSGFVPVRRTVRLSTGEAVTLALTLSLQYFERTIVTATRTGETDVQATPLAVSVIPAAELQRVQAHTVEDLAGRAPSVTFSQNTGFSQVTIRGIGTNVVFAGSDPSSSVYVDGVYLARPAMVLSDFIDLERVEVLRGPQGTLYGRNSVGGAINVITRPPTNDLEASARVDLGNASSRRVEARVSGPLVRHRVLASATLLRGYRSGFVRDLNHPEHFLGGEDVTAGSAKLQVVFNPRTDLLVFGDVSDRTPPPLVYAKVLAVKPGFQVDNPADLHDVRTSVMAEGRNFQGGGAARLIMRLPRELTLTSLTAYRSLDYNLIVDADITELDLTISNVHEIQHQLSQEVTLAQHRDRMQWVGGLFLLGDYDRQPTRVHLRAPQLVNHLDPRVDASSRALFGEATYRLTPRVSAIGGLRYTFERKTIRNSGQLVTAQQPAATVAGTAYQYEDAIEHSAWTPKAGVEVRLSARSLAYATATRGFKSGGFNLTSNRTGRGYDPEWASSYEGGFKTTGPNGRYRVNFAAFHTDYTDLQVQTAILPGVIDISNAAAATIRGVEIEGATGLSRDLRAGGHVAWLDATYDAYIAVGVGGVLGDAAGRRLSNAPEWSGRLWVERDTALGNAHVLSLRADARWQSTVFFTPFNDAIQRQGAYGVLDLSAVLQSRRGTWSAGLYARNLTNTGYITGTFSSPPPAIGGRPGDSRQFGVQVTFSRQRGTAVSPSLAVPDGR